MLHLKQNQINWELLPLIKLNSTGKIVPIPLFDFISAVSNYTQSITYANHPTSIINPFINDRVIRNKRIPLFKSLSEENKEEINSLLPLFFKNKETIKIPSKVESVLRKHTPVKLLKEIHNDKDVAIEFCLMFLSKLNGTYFTMKENRHGYEGQGWKSLHSSILIDEFPFAINTYKKIVEALKYHTIKGPIIECDNKYLAGGKCYFYRLGETYRDKGILSYQLKTKNSKELHKRNSYKAIARSLENPICKNLVNFYPSVELPCLEEVWAEGRKHVKEKYITKKGKRLSAYNKHSRAYFKDAHQRSFIEDSIELYDYLAGDGIMIPQESGEKSGGRVVDSFTLMPSWIRNICKINGGSIAEVDYSALHPNIAMSLYGGNAEFLTHAIVARETGLDLKDVKIEHLSFFNKTWGQMMQSPLYDYYWSKERKMMEKLCVEKNKKEEEVSECHKLTSRKMFKKEVEIMTDVIYKLNKEGIYVGYVYDALFCHSDQKQKVQQVMNEVILQHGVKTIAK